MTRITRNNINYNLRYDGYYLFVAENFWSQWLKFQQNAIVGYTFWSREEILGEENENQQISRSNFYEILHKFVLEEFPWEKESYINPYTSTGKYKIVGNMISFEIYEYVVPLRNHITRKFNGRILSDCLDLEQSKVYDGYDDVQTSTNIYEFVAFKF